MKLEYKIQQPFGANATTTYVTGGLKGHPGVDYAGGYGSSIHSLFDQEYVYKILDTQHPANDGSGFTGVFTIIDNGIEVFEFLYGHGDPKVTVGQICHKGDVIMTEANHGESYSGGTRITLEMQKNGDKRGSHVHGQKRILRKDSELQPNTQYITGMDGKPFRLNNYFFAIPFYSNGYNGCVDFMLPLFNRDLFLGCRGYDVGCLQRFLIARGFMQGEATEYFGQQTLKAVSAFQKVNNLAPIAGYCGKATRDIINNILQ